MNNLGIVLAAASLLTGCATCREKPAVCVATAVVVGVAAAKALDNGGRRAPAERPCFNLPADACR